MRRLFTLLAVTFLPTMLVACDDAPSQSAAAPPPPQVTVATPLLKKLIEWDEFTGRFEAVDSVEVRARVSGYLQSVHFKDGEIVQKDQLLFVIDPRPFETAVARAKADIAQAEANVSLSELELDRATRLVSTSAVARSTYDQRVQEKRVADATLASVTAALQRTELDLAYTTIRAPITGRISNRRIDVGNLVVGDGASTLLTTIVALDPLYFTFDMGEGDFLAYQRAVREGRLPSTRDHETMISVRLADERDWQHSGTMSFVDNRVDQGSGTIRARAVVPNPDFFITPGQFGRLRLPGSLEYDAMLIPDEAILSDQSRKLVMVVKDDGTVEPRAIRPGPTLFGLRIVRNGLKPEDRIIINGLLRARPGAKVTPEPGSIAAGPDEG